MAIEYITIVDGNGAPIKVAADYDGANYYQVCKLMLGGDGTFSMAISAGQQLRANSLPTVMATEDVALITPPANFTTGQFTVTNATAQKVAARAGRFSTTITNHSTTDLYFGPSGVSTTTGILLRGVVGAAIVIPGSMAIHGVAASGTLTCSYSESY